MARTKRYAAWTCKMSDFEGNANIWWRERQKKIHNRPIEDIVNIMNAQGTADGIGRNAPAWYRRTLSRIFRAKQNQTLRAAIAQSKDMDALIIEPRQRRNANWLWF